jgi:hypothetical protein
MHQTSRRLNRVLSHIRSVDTEVLPIHFAGAAVRRMSPNWCARKSTA